MLRNVQIAELESVRDKINEGGKPFCLTTLFPFLDWSVFAIDEKVGKYITKRFKTMMKEHGHIHFWSGNTDQVNSGQKWSFGNSGRTAI